MSLESADPHDSDVLREKNREMLYLKSMTSPFFIERFLVPKRVDFP